MSIVVGGTVTINDVIHKVDGISTNEIVISLPHSLVKYTIPRELVESVETMVEKVWEEGATALRFGTEVGVVSDVMHTLSVPMVKINKAWLCTSQLELRQW